jgi:DNA-binding CsgD family transcriptional regulator
MELYTSCSPDHLNTNFKNVCENYFIETFALAVLSKKNRSYERQHKLFSTFDSFPTEWIELYQHNKYYLNDPVFLRAQNTTMPYNWQSDKIKDIDTIQKKILSEAHDFGIERGTIIPLLPNAKCDGLLSLVDINIHHPEVLYILANASHIYLNRKEHFDLRNEFSILTDKEMIVLSLKAQGYINKSISAELSVSEYTVLFHLKNIKRKMGLITTEQVVFKYINYITNA